MTPSNSSGSGTQGEPSGPQALGEQHPPPQGPERTQPQARPWAQVRQGWARTPAQREGSPGTAGRAGRAGAGSVAAAPCSDPAGPLCGAGDTARPPVLWVTDTHTHSDRPLEGQAAAEAGPSEWTLNMQLELRVSGDEPGPQQRRDGPGRPRPVGPDLRPHPLLPAPEHPRTDGRAAASPR